MVLVTGRVRRLVRGRNNAGAVVDVYRAVQPQV